ncbi:MAG: DUF6498-containing protein [Xanthomonadales bacterium]|nr:DUF6498-containing protein [Xanthomonadales bacterium]
MALNKTGIRPRYGLQLGPVTGGGYRAVFPFKRPWVLIAFLVVFDVIFLFPAFSTFEHAAAGWADFEDLFDLVTAIFLSAWLLGWSIAPLLMTSLLLVLLFGREVLRVTPGSLELYFGIPGISLRAHYQLDSVRNLRLETPVKKSGKGWRGPHAAFDYGANTVEFGSRLGENRLAEIRASIEASGGRSIRTGGATERELSGQWNVPEIMQLLSEDRQAAAPASLSPPPSLISPSSLLLVAANLVPLAGSVFWGWNLAYVMVLYWLESAVIALFNLAKMAVIAGWFAIPSGIFFISHFGAFMAVHFLFIYSLFVQDMDSPSGGELRDVAAMFTELWPAVLGLVISHGFSFFSNFLGRGEHRGRTIKTQMTEPYSRIVFMHLVLIFGGGIAMVLGDSVPVLVLVIAAKVAVDLRAHLKQHNMRRDGPEKSE